MFISGFSDTIQVSSGVGETIHKEKWRGEIVGNLFYPIRNKPKGVILHIQGSAMLLQDARSICLANEGFIGKYIYNGGRGSGVIVNMQRFII